MSSRNAVSNRVNCDRGVLRRVISRDRHGAAIVAAGQLASDLVMGAHPAVQRVRRPVNPVLVEQPPYLCGPLIESDVGQGVGAPFEQSEDFVRPGLLSEDPRAHRGVQRFTAVRPCTGGGMRRHQPGHCQPHHEHRHQYRRQHQTGVEPTMAAPSQRRLREHQQHQHERRPPLSRHETDRRSVPTR